MIKTTIGLAAASLVFSGAALAQQTTPVPSTPSQPSATAPKTPTGQSAPAAPSSNLSFVDRQNKGEVLASELKGMSVKNSMDEPLGNISDVVMTDDGKVNAILVRVGGFLGIGASDVAIERKDVKVTSDKDGARVARVDATKEVLEKAPRYKTAKTQEDETRARQTTPPKSVQMPGAPGSAPKTGTAN